MLLHRSFLITFSISDVHTCSWNIPMLLQSLDALVMGTSTAHRRSDLEGAASECEWEQRDGDLLQGTITATWPWDGKLMWGEEKNISSVRSEMFGIFYQSLIASGVVCRTSTAGTQRKSFPLPAATCCKALQVIFTVTSFPVQTNFWTSEHSSARGHRCQIVAVIFFKCLCFFVLIVLLSLTNPHTFTFLKH